MSSVDMIAAMEPLAGVEGGGRAEQSVALSISVVQAGHALAWQAAAPGSGLPRIDDYFFVLKAVGAG